MNVSAKITPGWQRALDEADLTIWLTTEVPLMFRRLPIDGDSDEFWMGSRGYNSSEEPRHRVRITRPFYMGVFPVTQHQWRAVVETSNTDLKPNPSHFEGDLHPVQSIDWHDGVQWCRALQSSAALKNVVDGHGHKITSPQVTLPTEAQWEYACRAGTETEYYTGDGEAALALAGWYRGNSEHSTQPVGLLQPNAFGLYDMHGNVWEWCRDAGDEHAYKHRVNGVCDPEVQGSEGAVRVLRGGSWTDSPGNCRAAYRVRWPPEGRLRRRGFRVCLVCGPCPAGERSR